MSAKEKRRSEKQEAARAVGKIRARVIDAENGLRLLSGVRAVRIKSRGYNLLIMDDYMPALGQIDGGITFLTGDGELRLEQIRGFYKHQHNEFTLLIEEGAKWTE
ncbi:MAG: hypothetical protein IJQ98_00280 [Oscillospiraceae bacterium]|nr:hypothetical protein [Oscillospiraceae bacterium]